MKLDETTKLHGLLKDHPWLQDFLIELNPRFDLLRNAAMRATVGRVASLKMVAQMGEVDLAALLSDIAAEIERRTGEKVEVAGGAAAGRRAERIEALASIIRDLHDGGDMERARQRFAEAVGDVAPEEIAAMEQELIGGGVPVAEVQRLCDVHVGAFRPVLETKEAVSAPPGHPVHTYMLENRRIERLVDAVALGARDAVGDPARRQAVRGLLGELGGLDNHYARKENQLFPLLERHGIDVVPKVMWGVHDEIRAALRAVRDAAEQERWDDVRAQVPELVRVVGEMIYKEEKILLPMCLQTLDPGEWAEVRRGEDELGYAFVPPEAAWPQDSAGRMRLALAEDSPPQRSAPGLVQLGTGVLAADQVDLLLRHLPVDISFVDEDDVVRYYNERERHFPRSPAVIGRRVQNCHPPDSVHVVQKILDAFRAGERDVADFWISSRGRFLHIRYFAVRDSSGRYRGCLETSQDVTAIRALEGERRLLEWE